VVSINTTQKSVKEYGATPQCAGRGPRCPDYSSLWI